MISTNPTPKITSKMTKFIQIPKTTKSKLLTSITKTFLKETPETPSSISLMIFPLAKPSTIKTNKEIVKMLNFNKNNSKTLSFATPIHF